MARRFFVQIYNKRKTAPFGFLSTFLGQLCPREKAQTGLNNLCEAPALTGQTYVFGAVMWVLQRPLLNHDREDVGNVMYVLMPFANKTRKPNLLPECLPESGLEAATSRATVWYPSKQS